MAADPTPRSSLQLEDLHCARSGRLLFGALNATVAPGQLLRVQGANGAGKTSLLRMICGLLAPQRGRVLWGGMDIARLREEFGRRLLYIGHTAALKAELSLLENLQVALALAGYAPAADAARAALREAGLGGREHAAARTLSQGQRRRAALARLALAGTTPLWVLDEPFNALDRAASTWLLRHVTHHVEAGGIVVLTSHQDVALPAALPQVTLAL